MIQKEAVWSCKDKMSTSRKTTTTHRNPSFTPTISHNQRDGDGLVTKLRLSFAANGLRNMDIMSKSDPMLVAYYTTVEAQVVELGRTEVIANNLNPKWVKELIIDYHFEEVQPLQFVIYDVDTNYKNKRVEKLSLKSQDFLGEIKCMLAEITASPHQVLTRPLRSPSGNGNGRGSLTIRAEVVSSTTKSEELVMHLRCSDLENQEIFSKSDPFLKISRAQQDGLSTPVYETEHVNNNLNPQWNPIKMSMQQLCNGDRDRPLVIECFDYNGSGRHKLIGLVRVSANQLFELNEKRAPVILTRPGKHATKCRGKLFVDQYSVSPMFSFVDYLFGGCEICFLVAIDFTQSNGDPRDPRSLHYIDPLGRPNAYQTAIQVVGGVLQYYDTDKQFPCWGFGGKPDRRTLSHCFPLNNNAYNPEVNGIEGIMAVYSQAVCTVELYGPTYFAPVVNMAATIASQQSAHQKYFVLLIITDGAILDLQDTVKAVVAASHLPLSLLIVGVGNADFAAMDFLDSDKQKLTTQDGRVAVRDIVQFVPIQSVHNIDCAAKKLLKELPDQLVSYMKVNQIYPGQPIGQPTG